MLRNRFSLFTNQCRWNSTLVKDLKNICKNNCKISSGPSIIQQHSHDESHHRKFLPNIVIFPTNEEDISSILSYCNKNFISVIPYGVGTGLEGGVVPLKDNSISINMEKMNKIIEVNPFDFDCIVESGVTREKLNHFLKDDGLYFPIDPGANASLGGMCSTSASGTTAVRYGTMKENVLNLRVVLPSGEIIKTAGKQCRARKSSAGLNLTSLFVGSEGTLGVISEATLKLHAVPMELGVCVVSFKNDQITHEAVNTILLSGVTLSRMEYLNDVMVGACNKYSNLSLHKLPHLFIEVEGVDSDELNMKLENIRSLCESFEPKSLEIALSLEERKKLWAARHNCLYATKNMRNNSEMYVTDICVPLSNIGPSIEFSRKCLDETKLIGTILGHLGDGNYHLFIHVNSNDELEIAKDLSTKIAEHAISLDGTCTGEHGIGIGKRHLLKNQFDPLTYNFMKSLKKHVDPNGIMNPNKMFYLDE
ncbi:hypothetical protein SNEBB_007821 [Seison nebaliae]|nr:hypothetical protein SNEBB_007821 [Seison nebaliae]